MSDATTEQPTRLYLYKLTTDDGGAPCVEGGLLSLAICKPMIRTGAEAGDIILGFAANSLHRDNRLIYAARVTATLDGDDYYSHPRFTERGDCIYAFSGGRFTLRHDARFHRGDEHLGHDLGDEPDYDRARVLLSEDFRYFGGSGLVDVNPYRELHNALHRLEQGHRVNHSAALRVELESLVAMLWRDYDERVLGEPSHAREPGRSHREGGCEVVTTRHE